MALAGPPVKLGELVRGKEVRICLSYMELPMSDSVYRSSENADRNTFSPEL